MHRTPLRAYPVTHGLDRSLNGRFSLDNNLDPPTDGQAYIDRELEDALISSLATDPSLYLSVREHLPDEAANVFAARRDSWDQLVRAIQSGASTSEVARQTRPCADPIEAAQRLTELHWRRVLTRLAAGTQRDLSADQPPRQIAEALAAGLSGVLDLMRPRQMGLFTWADALIGGVGEDLSAAETSRLAGRRTMGIAASGLPTLDMVLDGWQPGALYVLGGAPGVGKTSLALQWACEAVVDRGVAVIFVTYENSPQNLTLKAIGRLAGIPPSAAQRGRADPGRWASGLERFTTIAPHLGLISADAGTSVEFLETTTREALRGQKGGALVIIDYLQRMAYGERFETLRDNVSVLAQRLRDLAVRLDVPVLALSALAAAVGDMPLRLSALAERGELEYASDVVLLLGPRADVGLASAARMRTTPSLQLLDLLVAKNRYGEANRSIPLLFRPSTGEFQEESLV